MNKVVGVIVIVAIGVGLKFYNRGEDDQRIKQEAKEFVSEMEFYAANSEYLDELIDKHHTAAFDASYNMGGRRKGATFDQNKYLEQLFHRMAGDAYKDQKRELGQALNRAEEVAKELAKEEP